MTKLAFPWKTYVSGTLCKNCGKRTSAHECPDVVAERDALLEALRTYRKATRWGWTGFCPVCEPTEDGEHETDCVVRLVEPGAALEARDGG